MYYAGISLYPHKARKNAFIGQTSAPVTGCDYFCALSNKATAQAPVALERARGDQQQANVPCDTRTTPSSYEEGVLLP